eukprot:684121-Rhodomonas_salina.1
MHRIEEYDCQSLASAAECPCLALALVHPIPNPDPTKVTLTDPVVGIFQCTFDESTVWSNESKLVVLRTTSPTVKATREVPQVVRALLHWMLETDRQSLASAAVLPSLTAPL